MTYSCILEHGKGSMILDKLKKQQHYIYYDLTFIKQYISMDLSA